VTEKRRVLVKTVVSVGDTVVIDGDAMLMVPTRA
jgi:3-hydroxybutyryl-CoA dehydratase